MEEHTLPDGRRIIELSETSAKLVALDGTTLRYMIADQVVLDSRGQRECTRKLRLAH